MTTTPHAARVTYAQSVWCKRVRAMGRGYAQMTYSIPLHGVLRGQAAELADGDGRVGRVVEAVRVRSGTKEDLALSLERLVETSCSGLGGTSLRWRGRRWGGGDRRRRRSSTGLALRVVVVELDASRAGVADGGTGKADTL